METSLAAAINKIYKSNEKIKDYAYTIRQHVYLNITPTAQIKDGEYSATVHEKALYMLRSISDCSVDNYLRDILSAADDIRTIATEMLEERNKTLNSEIKKTIMTGDDDDRS